ncbi:MAG: Smr/MutS family protein [Proteobacteria bacterium]|nr:Smr/MutS family protein [Pseudomonadota bacterium]MDA1356207.1 Smr/MutS family protein [Pseudomonadota bacterium]
MAHKRSVSREEQSLWRQVTGDVDPIYSQPLEEPKTRSAPDKAKKPKPPTAIASTVVPPPPPAPTRAKLLPELAPGKTAGLDKRNAQRLKRGQLRPEARVDLHGMTQSEAHAELNSFLAECWMADRRSVLVITGKGSVREGGVLRRMVPLWLNQPPLREMVIAIEQATPRDGGAGALYLLLRRRR